MPRRMKRGLALVLCCTLAVSFLAACGGPGSAQRAWPDLTITFTKFGGRATFINDVRDTGAINRLYAAAIALPPVPDRLFSCPEDDSGVYHLTFSDATFASPHMDVKASGCRFLTFTDTNDARMMDDAFVALFTASAGLASLEPFP